MTVERYIRIFAGIFIMTSLALGIEGSPLLSVNGLWPSQHLLAPIYFNLALAMYAPWVGSCASWACLMLRPAAQ